MRTRGYRRIQCDEIWSYVGKKQMHLAWGDDRQRLGDQWTFVAIDADTKLVPAYRVGKRTREHAIAFMTDLSERLSNRVQISSDCTAPAPRAAPRTVPSARCGPREKVEA